MISAISHLECFEVIFCSLVGWKEVIVLCRRITSYTTDTNGLRAKIKCQRKVYIHTRVIMINEFMIHESRILKSRIRLFN